MGSDNDSDDPRRRLLIKALSMGFFSAGVTSGIQNATAWSLFGDKPEKLPEGKSIYRLTGDVKVNSQQASDQTNVSPGDTVETGDDSEIIFAINGQSMILRSNTRLEIEAAASSSFISALRLVTGGVLSVSRNSPMKVSTATSTIGIRGTGWYAEADPELTYFCTCYGKTDVSATNDPESQRSIISKQHDEPLYITSDGAAGNNIRKAPFINHTDQELTLIEALVGRTPPFTFSQDDYSGPRREY